MVLIIPTCKVDCTQNFTYTNVTVTILLFLLKASLILLGIRWYREVIRSKKKRQSENLCPWDWTKMNSHPVIPEYLYVPGTMVKICAKVIYPCYAQWGVGVSVDCNSVWSNCVMRSLIDLRQSDASLELALCTNLGRWSSCCLILLDHVYSVRFSSEPRDKFELFHKWGVLLLKSLAIFAWGSHLLGGRIP